MSTAFEIAVLVGSLRKDSLTKKIAHALIDHAPSSIHCTLLEIGDLPLYNQDLEDNVPAAWSRFRTEISRAHAVLFLTPEYNRSIPACLKNAMDVGSRPTGKNVFDGLPAGVVSVTPYKMGAFGANHILRQSLVFLNMPVMQQPEAYIGGAADLFDEHGKLQNAETKAFLTKFMNAFTQWVTTIVTDRRRENFDEFMGRRATAAAAYVSGDVAPLNAMVEQTGAATFFPPNGGTVSGADEVAERYRTDAHAFSPGGTTNFDILQSGASGSLAFWTGFQTADVQLGGKPIKMKLRITELFRLNGREWKLVHRHADPASSTAR